MLTRQQLVALWGEESVVRFAAGPLQEARVPASAVSFLAEVGLPWRLWHVFTLEHGAEMDSGSSPAREPIGAFRTRRSALGEATCIGWDYVRDVCVVSATGEVVALPVEYPDEPERFVNSSVELFAACLYDFSADRQRTFGMTEQEIEASLETGDEDEGGTDEEIFEDGQRLMAQLRDRDPRAFEDEESWWPMLLQSLIFDML